MKQPKLNKVAREFHNAARQQGFELVRAGKHLTYRKDGVAEQITVSATPSDHRAMKNNLARLRRLSVAA